MTSDDDSGDEYRQVAYRVRAARWTGDKSLPVVARALHRVDTNWQVTSVAHEKLLISNSMRDEAFIVESGHWVIIYDDGLVMSCSDDEFRVNFERTRDDLTSGLGAETER